jgi:hypothetical protein
MKKILLLLSVVLVYSCKKDGASNKYLISSETVTTYVSPDSTITEQVSFQYNNQNLLSTVTRNWGPQYYVETDAYSYDNDGNITSLTLSTPVQTQTYTTTYSNGYPASTTYTGNNTSETFYYTFQNGRLTEADNTILSEALTYSGNNYLVFSYSDGYDYIYTYGSHVSPFKYTGYKYPLFGLPFVVNDNEITEIKTLNNNTVTNTQINNYTYNSNGYPSKLEGYTNGTLTSQVIFNYQKM